MSAVLGAIVGAVVTAQKAFPFGQRSSFYRLLIGQTDNLMTRATQGLWNKKEVVDTLVKDGLCTTVAAWVEFANKRSDAKPVVVEPVA